MRDVSCPCVRAANNVERSAYRGGAAVQWGNRYLEEGEGDGRRTDESEEGQDKGDPFVSRARALESKSLSPSTFLEKSRLY